MLSLPSGGERQGDVECRSDCVGDLLAVWTAEPGAGVPPGGGREAAVVALRYIIQGWGIYVEVGIDEPGTPGLCGIDACDEPGPQRRHRARSSDDRVLAVDPHIVSGLRVGVACHIGDPPHRQCLCPALGPGDFQPLLIWRQPKKPPPPPPPPPPFRPLPPPPPP